MLAIGMLFFSFSLAGAAWGRPEFRVVVLLPTSAALLLATHWQKLNGLPGITNPDFLFAATIGMVAGILGFAIGLLLRQKPV